MHGYFQIIHQEGEGPPEVDCKTKVLHPNIDNKQDGYDVCLNLFEEWQADFGVDDIIQGLLFLFYEPNWEDPFTRYPAILNNEGELSYTESIQKSLLGLNVANQDWPFNYVGDDLEELRAKYDGNVNTNEILQARPLKQNITSSNANDVPPAPPLPQSVTLNNASTVTPFTPEPPQEIVLHNSVPALTFNNMNNIPPAQAVPQNITSDSVNRITPVTLDPTQQILLHNSVPGPSLTNCLQHGELPIAQLNGETPVLPVHGRGVTGAATQMCDCSHGAAVQYSDDTPTDTIGHRQKPKHRTMRSRLAKYLGNIFLKMKRRVTHTSFHRR